MHKKKKRGEWLWLQLALKSQKAAMASAAGALDEAVKEYLVYRGFTNTLKQFELEKKDDKDKGFRVRLN